MSFTESRSCFVSHAGGTRGGSPRIQPSNTQLQTPVRLSLSLSLPLSLSLDELACAAMHSGVLQRHAAPALKAVVRHEFGREMTVWRYKQSDHLPPTPPPSPTLEEVEKERQPQRVPKEKALRPQETLNFSTFHVLSFLRLVVIPPRITQVHAFDQRSETSVRAHRGGFL